jgi:hypothetical protein
VRNVLAEDDIVVALVTVNVQRKGIREYQGDEQREDQFWS